MSFDSLKETFFTECEDLLDNVATGLAAMADGASSADTVNAVFRAVHSIKGAAGAFELTALVSFAHRLETALDAARSGKLATDAAVLAVMSRAGDVLADLVEAAREGREHDEEVVAGALAELDGLLGGPFTPEPAADFGFDFVPMAFEPLSLDAPGRSRFEIAFTPRAGFYENGHDPAIYLHALADLGDLVATCDLSRLPRLDSFDPEQSYLSWSATLETDSSAPAIEDVFAFAEGLCDLRVTPVIDSPPLVLDLALPDAAPEPEPEQAPAATEPKKPKSEAAEGAPRPTLRVDLDRVDRLVNSVGELIINQAAIAERLSSNGAPLSADLLSDLDDYKLLARQIQESVMAIRAQPVRPLFQRMARIVREAARATGKDVQLVTEGEATEVDRTVVESLADPLTHMVRNSIDHGLEPAELRREVGKPAQGTVWLSAEHSSGSVVIKVRDDGVGLNRERIRATAIRKGLITPDAELSPSEVDNLLFMPGFSTAAAVTNLSGRGVGLDVVKTAITSLGGRIGIDTVPGQGTTFSLILPLTLAVMDGMLVTAAGETMVIPLASILETIRPDARQLRAIGQGGHLLALRDLQVPVIDLAERLGLRSGQPEPAEQILLLIRTQDGALFAMGVDTISDQRQVVIKSLRENYGRVPGVSAATVLGDGRIALIVDPDAVVSAGGTACQPMLMD
jgi:two-component system chemotaxis sensor kinase CheA